MKQLRPPFRFDFESVFKQARRKFNSRIGAITINLPFISFNVNANDLEKQVAKEIVIRIADKRVLNAFECCDNCIDQALSSLQEIRRILVDQQVKLSNHADSSLYLLVELQAEAIRQFLTFEQRLKDESPSEKTIVNVQKEMRRSSSTREQYFSALEMLRAHLHRCLIQIAKIAEIEIPKISEQMRYHEAWELDAYKKPRILENGST